MEPVRQTFGRYEIVRPLGAGGMGEILLARQPGLPGVERLVVLKKILPHLAQEQGFLERFLDESRVAASLSHGNIVQVHEVGEVAGEYFMAMEYVEGMDLKEAFHRLRSLGRRVPEDLAIYILVEVAKALSYAHEKRGPDGRPLGIVHRDVSPANLLLSLDGQVKLTDFGVAKAALRLSLTLPGTLHGKVYYMSPEQVAGEDCDPRSDVFSLGVVAYEMLAGRRPFEGTGEMAVIEQVRRCEPPPLASVAPWVPGSLAALVARALAREPEGRYPTMEAFRQALTSYMLEAHTMVSARALADFLDGLRSGTPGRATTPPTPVPTPLRAGAPRSLDDIAAALLAEADGTPTPDPGPTGLHTRTVHAAALGGTPPGAAPPVAPAPADPASRGSRRERARRALPGLALLVGAAGLAAALWAWSLVRDLTRQAPPAAAVVETAAPAAADATAVPGDPAERPTAPAERPAQPAEAPLPAPGHGGLPPPGAGPETAHAAGPHGEPSPAAEERAAPRKVVVRSDPPGATVRAGDRDLGRAPVEVSVPPGGLRVEVSAPGRGPRSVSLTASSPSAVTVTLPPPPGRVKFRFFPADATVRIDGETVDAPGNVVDRELPAGPHVLVLTSRDGTLRREVPFDVPPGLARALGTLELVEPPAPAPEPSAPAAPPAQPPEGDRP